MKGISQKNTEIVKIEPIDIDIPKKEHLEKIGNKNALISQIPSLLASKQLSDAYRIVIPPGTSGKLMQYKDGLLGTPILKDGKVIGHAGLESMAGMVSPMLIFTAMSIVTGQYFLSQINKSLSDVLDEIKKIKDLLLLKEESALFSYSIFLKRISQEYSNINASQQLKTATLCNIQKTINELSASIYFYAHNSITELKKINDEPFKNELTTEGIRQNIEKLKAALDLRNMFIILEFSFSQSFDISTIEIVKNSISNGNKEIFNPFIEKILSTTKKMQEDLVLEANTHSKLEKLEGFLNELSSLNIGINKQYIKTSNSMIDSALDKLKQIDREGTEYYILDDGIYTKA